MSTLRVLLVDQHGLVRTGLRAILKDAVELEVVGEAADAVAALQLAEDLCPDVVIADLTLRGTSVGMIDKLRVVCPDVRVIVFTAATDIGAVRSALDAGVGVYMLKQSERPGFLEALAAVAQQRTYLDPQLRTLHQSPRGLTSSPLSEREREVLSMIAAGHSNKDIAAQLNLGIKTIETYRFRAGEKLGLRSRSDLVRYVLDRGWLPRARRAA